MRTASVGWGEASPRPFRVGAPLAALATTAILAAGAVGFIAAHSSVTSRSASPAPTPRNSLDPGYAAAFNGVMSGLDASSASASSRLRDATTARAQARAANELAAANHRAADSIFRLTAGAAGAANATVAAALGALGDAYASLARAAASHDPARYSAATASLTLARSRLDAAAAQLRGSSGQPR